jgi:hypothetical protein
MCIHVQNTHSTARGGSCPTDRPARRVSECPTDRPAECPTDRPTWDGRAHVTASLRAHIRLLWTLKMATTQEVKLFGKWTFDDVEVRMRICVIVGMSRRA